MTTSDALLMGLLLDTPPINPSGGGGGGSRYTVESLTFSGDLITDAVREAGVEGDGLTPPAGVGIWPAATNLVTQAVPGVTAGTGVTIIATDGSSVELYADPSAPFTGNGNVWRMFDNQAGAAPQIAFNAIGSTAAHSLSIWYYIESDYTPGATVVIQWDSNAPIVLGAVREQWVRLEAPNTTPPNSSSKMVVRTSAAGTGHVRFVAAQAELGSIATPYIETDGSTESRTAGRVQMPVAGLFTEAQGAVVARFKSGFSSPLPNAAPIMFEWRNASAPANALNIYRVSTTAWEMDGSRNGTLTTRSVSDGGLSVGTTGTLTGAWTNSTLAFSVDGAAFSSTTRLGTVGGSALPANAEIGSRSDSSLWITSNVLWFATFAGTLTDDDAAALNAFGDTPPTWAQLVGALPATAQVTGLWTCVNDQFFKAA